jgi:hypothetical protein
MLDVGDGPVSAEGIAVRVVRPDPLPSVPGSDDAMIQTEAVRRHGEPVRIVERQLARVNGSLSFDSQRWTSIGQGRAELTTGGF